MASIQQRGQSFRVLWREQRKMMHKSFPNRQEAEAFKITIERKTYRQALSARLDRITDPLPEIAARWIGSLSVAPITRASYTRSIFRPFLIHFENSSINQISTLDMQSYFAARRPLIKRSTLSKEYSILKVFWEWATGHFLLPENPMRMIRIRKVHKSPGLCLSYEQEWKLLRAASLYQRTKILLARDAGLRARNIGLLQRGGLDFESQTLTFHLLKKREDEPENAESRTLPLTARLAASLERFRPLDTQKLLFSYRGEPLRDPDKFLKRLRPALGFHFRWHDLRHTFYTRLLEACDNYALTEWAVGHSLTYWHPTPEKIREAFHKMEASTVAAIESLDLEAMLEPKEKRKED